MHRHACSHMRIYVRACIPTCYRLSIAHILYIKFVSLISDLNRSPKQSWTLPETVLNLTRNSALENLTRNRHVGFGQGSGRAVSDKVQAGFRQRFRHSHNWEDIFAGQSRYFSLLTEIFSLNALVRYFSHMLRYFCSGGAQQVVGAKLSRYLFTLSNREDIFSHTEEIFSSSRSWDIFAAPRR